MVESIPDEDAISRLIYYPRMYDEYQNLVWHVIFEFPGRDCESIVWRKYAPDDPNVHEIGEKIEGVMKKRRSDVRYVGFISADVGDVRCIKTANGHGFIVVHEPSEGLHHAHVCYTPADGRNLTKNDKNELKFMLRNAFDDKVTER